MTAADWSALAEWVVAATVIYGAAMWSWRHMRAAADLFVRRWPRMAKRVLRSEVTASAAWENVKQTPEVSMEAGIAYARTVARSGRAPFTLPQGFSTSEQPLDYLLAKTAEIVWAAAISGQVDLEDYLRPVRNYMRALIGKAGLSEARDFALGVLTERVRQEEDGWPDQPGEGKRGPHGSGNRHSCLLERKHEIENAIYEVTETQSALWTRIATLRHWERPVGATKSPASRKIAQYRQLAPAIRRQVGLAPTGPAAVPLRQLVCIPSRAPVRWESPVARKDAGSAQNEPSCGCPDLI